MKVYNKSWFYLKFRKQKIFFKVLEIKQIFKKTNLKRKKKNGQNNI